MTELQEARLLGRAIRSRWNVPTEVKQQVMDTLTELCESAEQESSRIAAAKAIIAAEAQNQKDEHLESNEFRARLLDLASRIGVSQIGNIAIGNAGEGTPVSGRTDED